MKKPRHLAVLGQALLATFIFGGGSALAAADDIPCKLDTTSNVFFGFPHWWDYLNGVYVNGVCSPDVAFPGGIWPIGLAIVNMLLHVAGIIAVISIMIAGVMYLTSSGSPDRTSNALSRIINSLVGLAIVLVATAVVAFIGSRVT